MLALHGHSGNATAVAFSPCGRWLVSAGWDGTVRLWERPAYEARRILRTPYDHAVAAAFSADGTHLMAGFRNRDSWPDPVIFGNLAWTPVIPRPGADPHVLPYVDTWFALDGSRRTAVRRLAPHPSLPNLLAVAGDDRVLRVWDVAARVVARTSQMAGHWSIADVRFSSEGSLAWIAPALPHAGKVFFWEEGQRQYQSIAIEDDAARTIGFETEGEQLFIGLNSGRLALWESGVIRRPKFIEIAGAPLVCMAATPDDRALYIASEDGMIHHWDRAARRVRERFDWRIGDIGALAIAPDGLTIAAAGEDVILVWDLDQ